MLKSVPAIEIIGFSCHSLLGKCFELFIDRNQFFRTQITRGFRIICAIGGFFLAHDPISHLDGLAAVLRFERKHANVVSIIAVLNLVPFDGRVQFFDGHVLKNIGLRER